jgi:hypothetical protein
MFFLWEASNIAHVALHGLTRELVEKIVEAGQDNAQPRKYRNRYSFEATIDNRHYRAICDISRSGAIYPVTAFLIRKRKQ